MPIPAPLPCPPSCSSCPGRGSWAAVACDRWAHNTPFLTMGTPRGAGAALGPPGPTPLCSFFLRHRLCGCVHECACVRVSVRVCAGTSDDGAEVAVGHPGWGKSPRSHHYHHVLTLPTPALWLLGPPEAAGTGLPTPRAYWLQPGYLPAHWAELPSHARHGTHVAGLALATLTPQPLWDFYLFSVFV